MANHENLDKLAFELFQVFSRTEYALKASGFNHGDGNAKANWREFALAIEALIVHPTSLALEQAIACFHEAPPKKQIIVDGAIQWEVREPQTDSEADKLLTYVRRVRNNLFHGGKFNGHWFAPERSAPLLRHSITILIAAVRFVPSVRDAYDH
ncbi:hypothetical protein EGT81_09445 [Alcaligenes faecalis]|nr:hypothetical protein [Alcaligenes faecalis]RSE62670.1 hypothetical protein EGT81_09445 [Alcaligenes faecalis]